MTVPFALPEILTEADSTGWPFSLMTVPVTGTITSWAFVWVEMRLTIPIAISCSQAPRPANLPDNVLWRDKPRYDIPGSIWLPDTGYGALAPEVERYLFDGLARASGGDKGKPILFYCQRNCWMSWNAAKRALQAGYSNVIWFPDGTEGWSEENYPFEERRPKARG